MIGSFFRTSLKGAPKFPSQKMPGNLISKSIFTKGKISPNAVNSSLIEIKSITISNSHLSTLHFNSEHSKRFASWLKQPRDEETTRVELPVTINKIKSTFESQSKWKKWAWMVAAALALVGVPLSHYYNKTIIEEVPKVNIDIMTQEERDRYYQNIWTTVMMTPHIDSRIILENGVISLFCKGMYESEVLPFALATLSARPDLREEVIKQLPWSVITDKRSTLSQPMTATFVLTILEHISTNESALDKLVQPSSLDMLGTALTIHQLPDIQSKAAAVLRNIAKSDKHIHYIVDLMNPLCDFAAMQLPQSFSAFQAVALLVEHGSTTKDNKFLRRYRPIADKQQFSEKDLEVLSGIASNLSAPIPERSGLLDGNYLTFESFTNAAIYGTVWGAVRWGIKSFRNQIRRPKEIFKIIGVRTPITILGAAMICAPSALEHNLIPPEYQIFGLSKNQTPNLISSGSFAFLQVAVMYLMSIVAPFSVLPGVAGILAFQTSKVKVKAERDLGLRK